MDRPKRARKSTKNYENFYYPTPRRRKNRENDEKVAKELRTRPNPQGEPSISSIPKPPVSPSPKVTQKPRRVNLNSINPKVKDQAKGARLTITTETQTDPTKRTLKEIFNELYKNPDYPTAFGGQLKKFILSKDSISKHRQRRKTFKRRKIFVTGPYVGVQADTINYRTYARYNSGFRYILGRLQSIVISIKQFFSCC